MSFTASCADLRADASLIATLGAALVAVSLTLFLILPTLTPLVVEASAERLGPKEAARGLRKWFRLLAVSVVGFVASVVVSLVGYFMPGRGWVFSATAALVASLAIMASSVAALARRMAAIAFKVPE